LFSRAYLAAPIVRRESFANFSESGTYLGENGGLDICAAELTQRGIKFGTEPKNIFSWRVTAQSNLILETSRPGIYLKWG
jgi:hypothetical protein